jgi:hypothetical protein
MISPILSIVVLTHVFKDAKAHDLCQPCKAAVSSRLRVRAREGDSFDPPPSGLQCEIPICKRGRPVRLRHTSAPQRSTPEEPWMRGPHCLYRTSRSACGEFVRIANRFLIGICAIVTKLSCHICASGCAETMHPWCVNGLGACAKFSW